MSATSRPPSPESSLAEPVAALAAAVPDVVLGAVVVVVVGAVVVVVADAPRRSNCSRTSVAMAV
jgi:hypothetical protein